MLISSFLQPSAGGTGSGGTKALWFNIQAVGQGSLRQAIMYDYITKATKSKG